MHILEAISELIKLEKSVICPKPNLFGEILEAVKLDREEPKLGCATTEQLLDELRARACLNGTLNYRAVDQ